MTSFTLSLRLSRLLRPRALTATAALIAASILFASPAARAADTAPAVAPVAVNQVPMLWEYDTPATRFWEGLPIGTGRFAAMIPGGTAEEIIPFNDETLWTGGPYNPNNPYGPAVLAKVREAALAKDWATAHTEAFKLGSKPQNVQLYQPMGRLNLRFHGHEFAKVKNYRRALNMDDATTETTYELDGTRYTRRVFASYPDQAIVIRITADKPGKVSVRAHLNSLQPSATATADANTLLLQGTTISKKPPSTVLPPQMKWQARLRILHDGGKVTTPTLTHSAASKHYPLESPGIYVHNANSVTFVLVGATNWKAWNDITADATARAADYLTKATAHTYDSLLQRHLADYRPRFATCRLDLGADPAPDRTTTASILDIRRPGSARDAAYEARYFQYGRYLLLAGAREGTLAFNNHNIWLDNLEGRWHGRWTLNININECYWPVETTNLPEVNDSLLLFTEQLAAAGARTAKELYNFSGWVAHHGTDIWFNTAPTDGNPWWAMFPLSGPWLLQQLYEHHLHAPGDTAYLRRIYPLLRGSVEATLALLVEEPDTHHLVTCPSTSPENSFVIPGTNKKVGVSYGSAADMQLVRRLFHDYLEAATTLNAPASDNDLRARVSAALLRLPPHKIGKHGQLQEWFFDFPESEVTHRHLMHLYAFYPDDDIALRKTPELIQPIRTVLNRRESKHNRGWASAWKINLYARLGEPDRAYQFFRMMLTDTSIHPYKEDSSITPSFEGNQGIQAVTAGVAELLMQSHSGELALLPALPVAWPTGAISGLRARGGFGVDIAWRDGALTNAQIKVAQGVTKPLRLRTKSPVKVIDSYGDELPQKSLGDGLVELSLRLDSQYTVLPR